MTLINLQSRSRRGIFGDQKPNLPGTVEDLRFDISPDWSIDLGEAELAAAAERNRPSIVLWDVARTVIISVGMVVALMALLTVFHIR